MQKETVTKIKITYMYNNVHTLLLRDITRCSKENVLLKEDKTNYKVPMLP